MASTSITIRQDELLINLGNLQTAVGDRDAILRKVGAYMYGSVMTTYREEGSPAGSWPALAASTLKKKGYTAGHKLLVLSGRLFGSMGFQVSGNSVAIGSQGVKYAGVQFYGSADRRGGSIGPQAKIAGRSVKDSAYDGLRVNRFRRYGTDKRVGSDGKTRTVHVRAQGADSATRYHVGEHDRHQNIPARNPLVFRPEDIPNMISMIDAYFAQRSAAVRA